jgi:hypothetical protein
VPVCTRIRTTSARIRARTRPFALPRPDTPSPLLNRPVFAAHNTRRYEHTSPAVLAEWGGAIQLFDFLCRLARVASGDMYVRQRGRG